MPEHTFSIVAVSAPLMAGLGIPNTAISLMCLSVYEKHSIQVLHISRDQLL
jgi:hypothetical protein